TITEAPDGFAVTASTPTTPAAAFESPARGFYGVQFHPEVVHTPQGQEGLRRFLYDACGCRPTWTRSSIIESQVQAVPEQLRSRGGAAGGLEDARCLVRGTLSPDVIESGGGHGGQAATIKSHHNVGGLAEDMDFELVEPLRALFKDEVRKVGEELGLPAEIVWRQPFPGPGLGVRIIGEVTPERVAILQRADAIVREEIKKAELERDIWQAFAVLPD